MIDVQDCMRGDGDDSQDEDLSADDGIDSLTPVEVKYMQSWNEIMYSSLRRRNAVYTLYTFVCMYAHLYVFIFMHICMYLLYTFVCIYARYTHL